jgi:hypothetical protein
MAEPMSPARRDLIWRLGWTTGCIGAAAGELPDARLEDVIRTLEHAAELLADESGVRIPPRRPFPGGPPEDLNRQ